MKKINRIYRDPKDGVEQEEETNGTGAAENGTSAEETQDGSAEAE